MGLNEKQYKPNVVAGRISEAKNALIMAGEYGNDPLVRDRDRADGLPQIAKIYATYQARLLASDAMDFDDLLLQTYVLFDQHPDVALRCDSGGTRTTNARKTITTRCSIVRDWHLIRCQDGLPRTSLHVISTRRRCSAY